MRATELMTHIPGITMDHLHNWERQGYLAPNRMKVGKKRVRDYSEKEANLIKVMWFYYRKGLSPKNAYRNATEEVSQRSLAASTLTNEDLKDQESAIDSPEGIAIFELAIPLRHYFHLKSGGKKHGWMRNS